MFLLCSHEIEAFNELFQDDEELTDTVQECADFWRNTLRPQYDDHIICRQRFFIRTLIRTARCQSGKEMTPSLC